MGEIINKIEINNSTYELSIPYCEVSSLDESDGSLVVAISQNPNPGELSQIPSVGQLIAIKFNIVSTAMKIKFETSDMVSAPMVITYCERGMNGDSLLYLYQTQLMYVKNVGDVPVLEIIGDFTTYAPLSHATSSSIYGVGTTSNYGHVRISNGDVNSISHSNGLVAGMDHTHGNYAPKAHASNATTYGVGSSSYYGHVKTVSGNLSTITSHTNGYAAAAYHKHDEYATSSHEHNYMGRVFDFTSSTIIPQTSQSGRNTLIEIRLEESQIVDDFRVGDVFIIPITSDMTPSGSLFPNAGISYVLYNFIVTTPNTQNRTFTFNSTSSQNRFLTGIGADRAYNLLCVVGNNDILSILNPIDTFAAYASYAAEASYATYADNLTEVRYIDGLGFDGSSNVSHFGTCSTVGSTSIKSVTITGLTSITGAIARVKFSNAHTLTSSTTSYRARLKLNGQTLSTSTQKGVIRAFSTGYYITTLNSWKANQIVEMIYDGTYWNIISPYIMASGGLLYGEVGGGSGTPAN